MFSAEKLMLIYNWYKNTCHFEDSNDFIKVQLTFLAKNMHFSITNDRLVHYFQILSSYIGPKMILNLEKC